MGGNKATGKILFDEVMRATGMSWESLVTRISARGRYQGRLVIERPNGTRAPADIDAQSMKAADGGLLGVLCVFSDRAEL